MLIKVLRFSSLICFLLLLIIILQGHYYTGDTISHLEASFRGKPLTIFLQHQHEWPPALSFVFYIMHFSPFSVIDQLTLFTVFVFCLTNLGLYFIFREMKLAQNFFVMSFLILASGKQIFLLQSAIAENVFILFSIWSLFFLYRFFNQEKDQELFQFLLVASLLPFTRYIGIAFIIGFTCILIVYCFKKKPQRKSSVFFILCILILLWMPINFYLLKNKIIEGSFFGSRDLAVNISLITSLTSRVLTVVSDLSIPILISFIFGFNLVWKKQYKYMIQISLMAFVFYIAIMAFSDTRYMVYDNFPSRTLSPSYPLLLLGVIFLGSWFRSKININAALLKIMLCIVFIFSIQKIIFISKQYTNRNNFVLGAEYSRNIEQFCHNTPATKSYILIQQFSRNHIGQSFKYYCPHIIPIDFEKTILLLKGEFIYSPYNIESQFIMQNKIYYSSDTSKRMYQYKIKADITTNFINIKELLKQLD